MAGSLETLTNNLKNEYLIISKNYFDNQTDDDEDYYFTDYKKFDYTSAEFGKLINILCQKDILTTILIALINLRKVSHRLNVFIIN